MARLPAPGGDPGKWGAILNDYLAQAHEPNGQLKDVGVLASKYVKPLSGIPTSDLDQGIRNVLNVVPDHTTELAQHATTLSDHSSTLAQHSTEIAVKASQSELTVVSSRIDGALKADGTLKDQVITRAALDASVAAAVPRNILEYGVVRGTSLSQTAAIKAALDSEPGACFYFPPGDYRLDTSLVVANHNSLILAPEARIYAGAPLDILIDYNPGPVGYPDLYAKGDKIITGGLLDGNLNANTILNVSYVIHLTIDNVQFADGLHRGLTTTGDGAEVFAANLRFFNRTPANWDDNVAIVSDVGDCHYSDIVILNWTIGVWEKRPGKWTRIHPWISQAHIAARYPISVAFSIAGDGEFQMPYADTYRTAFKVRKNVLLNKDVYARIHNATVVWQSAVLDAPTATANPGVVMDIEGTNQVNASNFWMVGHSTAPTFFAGGSGSTAKLTASNMWSVWNITGAPNYLWGIPQGSMSFTPTFGGTTANGTHTYTSQVGRVVVNGSLATMTVRLKATLDNTINGDLTIMGLPVFAQATEMLSGGGVVGLSNGVDANAIVVDSTNNRLLPKKIGGGTTAAISAYNMRGWSIELWCTVQYTVTFI